MCQVKINVTNAYAGSIAWSNFFSRVTHAHPGRVVWLVFNVLLALLLMEVGIFEAIESVLALYANFAAGWIGAITADLVINKPLGLSPRGIEFKRAHLYDINPVGVGALAAAVVLSSVAHLGVLGETARVLSPFIALGSAMIVAPLIAWWTRGALLPGPQSDPGQGHRHLLDLREPLREGRHGAVPGLRRLDLLAVLFAGFPLPRPVQGRRARCPSRWAPFWASCCRRAWRRWRTRAAAASSA